MYKILSSCSGCHTCELQCPVGAIHYEDIQYQIDQNLCIGCGGCYDVCPTCSIQDTDAPAPTAHAPTEKTCDVLVCGGGSGIVAAVRAAQAGKKVILVEKSGKIGGNTTLAHGFMVPYSKIHEKNGAPDMREKMVNEVYQRAEGWIGKDMLRAAFYGITEFFDWLCQFPGADKAFTFQRPNMPGPMGMGGIGYNNRMFESLGNLDPSIGPGWMGTYVQHTMLDAIRDQNLDVEILCNTAAKHLLTADNGAVVGAVCEDAGGTVTIHADAVILATGGMGSSDEKLQKYFGFCDYDRQVMRFSVPGDTGDAIDMLEELGVKPDRNRMFLSMFGPAHHPWAYSLYKLLSHPSALVLNLRGERFFDEAGGHIFSRMLANGLPKGMCWGIITDELIDYMEEYYKKMPAFGDDPNVTVTIREEMEKELKQDIGSVFRCDTLEQLAQCIGMEPDTLISAVERYNQFCADGKDPEYEKDPRHLQPLKDGPYYAIKGICFSEGAFGGLRVTKNCEVTTTDGKVIPGLYGVGDATSTMHRQTILAPVSELTWAMASSYISGGNAVAYSDKREV